MASYSVLFFDKSGNSITGKNIYGEIPANTSKLVIENTSLGFRDNWGSTLEEVTWEDIYQGTGIETILYNGNSVNYGEEIDYSDGDITINVCYEYTPQTGETGGTGDDTPMVVTFNYYVDGISIDDDTLNVLNNSISQPVEETWPRTLECYHIRFDKINPIGHAYSGTSCNSIEFTYIYEENYGNSWPSHGTLNNTKTIQAFSHRYFSEKNCVTINGIGYEAGEDFTETPQPVFHSVNTKTLEVNLYYTSYKVSTIVRSYNVDDEKYSDYDLWGYVSAQMGRVPSNNFTTTNVEYKYAVPLTSGYSMYCKARAKGGFEFYKWVSTSEINSIHSDTENYKTETARRNAVLALPAIESLDDSLPDDEIKISAYSSKDITAVFKSVKNEVKLYKGLDFSGGDIYHIWGGSKQWLDNKDSDVDITIPTREGAKLLGWVEYNQEDYGPDTKEYPSITRSEYTILKDPLGKNYSYEDIFNYICDSRERIISGVIFIDNPEDENLREPILLSKNDGYTDSYGNWLAGDKTLYPLWLLEEYDIKYVSDGKESLVIYETETNPDGSTFEHKYEFNPIDFSLPLTYTIVDDITFKSLKEENTASDVDFPQYRSFDKWDPSEIKQFTKTGPLTITAYWILDTYKITLERNNNFANQTVKIKSGESTFVNGEEIHNPTTRPDKDAYDEFVGWYTENNEYAKNGTGKLLIDTNDKLQPNVSGYTDSDGKWIKHENTTVYARWTPNEYTITYRIKDNNGNESIITEKYTIEDTKPNGYQLRNYYFGAPEGHDLDSWYTDESYSSSKISMLENGSYGNKTFYGRFKPSEFTIRYNNIDSSSCSNYEDLPVKHTYGVATELIEPRVSGYRYLGWYTDEELTNKVTGFSANYIPAFTPIDLYTKFVKNPMSIIYKDTNGNVLEDLTLFNSEPPTEHTYGTQTTLVGLHKNGYTFDGWYDNIECEGESFMELGAKDYLDDIVLYFKFTPIEYTIKYYIDGVEITNTVNPSKYTIEDLPITLKNPSDKLGYHSIGWRRNSSSSTTVVNQITYSGDWNLYWVWEPNVITITWDANGGSVTSSTSQYTYDGESITLPIPTRTGYDFAGWYTSITGGTKITDVGVNNKPTEDTTYYALWNNGTSIKYTVKHCKQALDGTYSTNHLCITEEYNGTAGDSVTPNVRRWTGFTSPSKQTVIIASDGSTVVVYNYERNKYNITWDVNGGEALTGNYTNGSVYYETPIILPNNPTKEGYVFSGWSPTVPETMHANDIVFTALYTEEKTNLISEIIDVELESVKAGKIATDKWINNIIGEPEKTKFEHLNNFFNTNFGNNISGECVTGNDLENFFDTEPNKCIKQSQFIQIFYKSENISNGYIIEKNYTFNISSNSASNLEFIVNIPENEPSIPNYPDTEGFIMYYTIGNNPTLYKTCIPINKSCYFSLENASDSIVIHRIPLYYWSPMNACILPKITIQNNNGTHKIVGDTPIEPQIE